MTEGSRRSGRWIRNGLAAGFALALFYWLGANRPIQSAVFAASEGDPQFQLTSLNQTSSLLVYQPDSKTIYVYQGATTGSSTLQCSFKFQLGKPGGVIQRTACPAPSLLP